MQHRGVLWADLDHDDALLGSQQHPEDGVAAALAHQERALTINDAVLQAQEHFEVQFFSKFNLRIFCLDQKKATSMGELLMQGMRQPGS